MSAAGGELGDMFSIALEVSSATEVSETWRRSPACHSSWTSARTAPTILITAASLGKSPSLGAALHFFVESLERVCRQISPSAPGATLRRRGPRLWRRPSAQRSWGSGRRSDRGPGPRSRRRCRGRAGGAASVGKEAGEVASQCGGFSGPLVEGVGAEGVPFVSSSVWNRPPGKARTLLLRWAVTRCVSPMPPRLDERRDAGARTRLAASRVDPGQGRA